MDQLSLAVELSGDSDDVSDDVTRYPRSRPLTRGASRDPDHVVDEVDGRGGYRSSQRRGLPSNNIQLATDADDDSDDAEPYHRILVICMHNSSHLHNLGPVSR